MHTAESFEGCVTQSLGIVERPDIVGDAQDAIAGAECVDR